MSYIYKWFESVSEAERTARRSCGELFKVNKLETNILRIVDISPSLLLILVVVSYDFDYTTSSLISSIQAIQA